MLYMTVNQKLISVFRFLLVMIRDSIRLVIYLLFFYLYTRVILRGFQPKTALPYLHINNANHLHNKR